MVCEKGGRVGGREVRKGSPHSENTGDAGRLAGMTASSHVTSSESG